jgi:hypothetical protein
MIRKLLRGLRAARRGGGGEQGGASALVTRALEDWLDRVRPRRATVQSPDRRRPVTRRDRAVVPVRSRPLRRAGPPSIPVTPMVRSRCAERHRGDYATTMLPEVSSRLTKGEQRYA